MCRETDAEGYYHHYALIGSPAKIAGGLVLSGLGVDGVTLSFVDFRDELPFFIDRVLPLLRQAALPNS